MSSSGSRKVASVAIQMALSESREEEATFKRQFSEKGFRTAAVDYGGEFSIGLLHLDEVAVGLGHRAVP
ncbi:MAG: HutP family protein [Bacillota bacterium]